MATCVAGMIAADAVMDDAGCDGISATSNNHRRVYKKGNQIGLFEPEKKIGDCFTGTLELTSSLHRSIRRTFVPSGESDFYVAWFS